VVRYLVHIRTNVVILVADAVGSFFFVGVSTFAVLYLTKQYGLSVTTVDLAMPLVGAAVVTGTLLGGHLADRVSTAGNLGARITLATGAFVLSAALLLPAILTRDALLGGPLLLLGAGCQVAANPILDAIRIDIVHPQIRGRAESVRGVLSVGASALAPLTFGFLSSRLAGGGHRGLQATFLMMLAALAANGVLLLAARRDYPREATAVRRSRPGG
jgi:MFS family permease